MQLVAGMFFTCGINIEQKVVCWGFIRSPSDIDGLFVQITAGSDFACGVMTNKKISCWGDTRELIPARDSHSEYINNPNTTPLNEDLNYVQISCSKFHCCALDDYGLAHCFGRGAEELAPPTTITVASSARMIRNTDYEKDEYENQVDLLKGEYDNTEDGEEEVNELAEELITEKKQFKQISVGDGHSCGILLESDDIECWGRARWHFKMPRYVHGPFRQVSVGPSGMCAIYSSSDDAEEEGEVDKQDVEPPEVKMKAAKVPSDDYDNGEEEDGEEEEEEEEKSEEAVDASSKREEKELSTPATKSKEDTIVCFGNVDGHLSGAEELLWDQVLVGPSSLCGVTLDSRLVCYGVHSKEDFPHDMNIALA